MKYGADHILLGTDHPYDTGEDHTLDLILRTGGLSHDQHAAACGLNAARLLKLDVEGA